MQKQRNVGKAKHIVVTKNMLISRNPLKKVKLSFSPLTYNPI